MTEMTPSIDDYTVNELRKFMNDHKIPMPTTKNGNITKKDLLKALTGEIEIGSSPINDNWINIVDWANSKLLQSGVRSAWWRYESFDMPPLLYKLPNYIKSIPLGNERMVKRGASFHYNERKVSRDDLKIIKNYELDVKISDKVFGRVLGFIYPGSPPHGLAVTYKIEKWPIFTEVVPLTVDFNKVIEKYTLIRQTLGKRSDVKLEVRG